MSDAAQVRITFERDCACKGAGAMTGRVTVDNRYDEKTYACIVTVTHWPMPTCNNCHKPWRRIDNEPTRQD